MRNQDLALRTLDPNFGVKALQQILENAPRYSLNVSGALQPVNAAEEVFSAVPSNFERSKKYVYGIFLNSQPVGCIDVLRGYPSEDTAMIGLLLLAESEQAKGLGKLAYRSLESIISSWSEVSRIRISVVRTNDEVLGFWKKMGFLETGGRRPYENGSIKSEAIILEKPIT
jgi:hypothetical protein